MSSDMFSGDIWTKVELKDLLKKLEQMFAGGLRQSSFKDQMLLFGSTSEIKERILFLREEITRRDDADGTTTGKAAASKKVVRIQSGNKGFGHSNKTRLF